MARGREIHTERDYRELLADTEYLCSFSPEPGTIACRVVIEFLETMDRWENEHYPYRSVEFQ